MSFAQLSKSKKAVLINVGDGRILMTSVVFLRKLLDGQAHGNMIFLMDLNSAKDKGLGSVQEKIKVTPDKVSGFEGFN